MLIYRHYMNVLFRLGISWTVQTIIIYIHQLYVYFVMQKNHQNFVLFGNDNKRENR